MFGTAFLISASMIDLEGVQRDFEARPEILFIDFVDYYKCCSGSKAFLGLMTGTEMEDNPIRNLLSTSLMTSSYETPRYDHRFNRGKVSTYTRERLTIPSQALYLLSS